MKHFDAIIYRDGSPSAGDSELSNVFQEPFFEPKAAKGVELVLVRGISEFPSPVNADFGAKERSFDFRHTTDVQLLDLGDISHRNGCCFGDFGSDMHDLSFGQI